MSDVPAIFVVILDPCPEGPEQQAIKKILVGTTEVKAIEADLHFEADIKGNSLNLKIPLRYVHIIAPGKEE